MNGNLFARLTAGFPTDRHAPLLETAAGAAWSAGQVLDLAGRMAMLLRAAGVGPGDRVAAQVATSPEAVCLYLACLQAGAIFAPLDPGYAPAELAWLLDDLEPRLAVCDPDAEGEVAGAARTARAAVYTLAPDGTGRLTAEAAALPSDRAVSLRQGRDAALILRTTGADGRSRGTMLSHDALWANVAALHWLWGFRPGDVLAHALPLHRSEGLAVALNLALLNGGGMILLPRFDPAEVAGHLARASVLVARPEDYAGLLGRPGLAEAATGLRLAASVGPLAPAVRAGFAARTGQAALEAWGAAEIGVAAAAFGADEAMRALPGVGLRAVGPDGAALAPGRAGALQVRGPNVGTGYWRDPEAAATFHPDGWFETGVFGAVEATGVLRLEGEDRAAEPDCAPRRAAAGSR